MRIFRTRYLSHTLVGVAVGAVSTAAALLAGRPWWAVLGLGTSFAAVASLVIVGELEAGPGKRRPLTYHSWRMSRVAVWVRHWHWHLCPWDRPGEARHVTSTGRPGDASPDDRTAPRRWSR